jgi:hypothetical protein
MSDGEFHAFVGLLAAGGLLLGVLAVLGFDQRAASRIADGVVAAGYLGCAAYLQVTRTSLPIYYFAAGAPVLLLLLRLLRERSRARRKRLAAGLTKMYLVPPANTPLTPFPAPPPPLDPSARTRDQPPEPVAPRAYRPMPSGLPPRDETPPPAHAEPAGHDTASAQETSSRLRRPAYLDRPDDGRASGRHRAADSAD